MPIDHCLNIEGDDATKHQHADCIGVTSPAVVVRGESELCMQAASACTLPRRGTVPDRQGRAVPDTFCAPAAQGKHEGRFCQPHQAGAACF